MMIEPIGRTEARIEILEVQVQALREAIQHLLKAIEQGFATRETLHAVEQTKEKPYG